ncbi:hypothetical protein PLESTB_000108200 [Pleodorina starrii]|uniref:Uncharacterized protein n=1 Tax=Pleodorina starrii TaxID=330485 RepID=A0A9W6BBD4_9CHLO|nr:hypothetical protein PLESTB_000108200 [Pleodorina starrii]
MFPIDKAVLRFILSGNTSFWSRPEVATRIGFGTAPWRCVNNCQAQYYASAQECAPDCTAQTYCVPGGAALSDPNTTCCALSLLDQSYNFSHPPSQTTPDWCSAYPTWTSSTRPSVCDFNAYTARGAVPPGGADDPLLAVSCKRDNSTAIFHVNGTYYRNDTATRIIHDRDIRQTSAQRNVVKRISLRHTPAWHHPSIDLTRPPEFSLVDDLVCLPLEEIYFEDVSFRPEHELLAIVPDRSGPNGTTFDLFNHTTWKCDRMDGQKAELADFGFPGETGFNVAPSYFVMLLDPCGVGRALVSRNVSSLNPNLALRNVAMDKCLFAPFTELNAMRWSARARLEWSKTFRQSLENVKYGNQSFPKSSPPPVPDPVAARPFLPDTLKRITIKRTLDGRHPSQTWRSRPVVQGFLPSEWALLRNLEYLDLSDETGQGLIEGPIPSTWLMMTKLRTINLTGHPNFCKDWHRVVSYQIQTHVLQTSYGVVWGLSKRYYGPKDPKNRARQWNVTVFDMDGAGWQWYDSSTGEAGYTAVIAPDGKCCWDTFSDQFAARNYTLEGPSETSGPWDYYGVMYSRLEVCERSLPYKPTGMQAPLPPASPAPPDVPPTPPSSPTVNTSFIGSNPRPPLLPPLPGISPLRPNAPPQPPSRPISPGKWSGGWAWRPHLPPRPPPPPAVQAPPLPPLTPEPPFWPKSPNWPGVPQQPPPPPSTPSSDPPPPPPTPPPPSSLPPPPSPSPPPPPPPLPPSPSPPPSPPSLPPTPPTPPSRPPRPPRPPPAVFYGPWDAAYDLNEQHKAVLRFILSGDTSFWSRPEVATRIGFGTAPWRCVNNCQAQYYASAQECAPDCTTQTYCEPGGAALSDPNTTCCALSLLDQSYSFSHPPSQTMPDWCSAYPDWTSNTRPSVCDFNAYTARGAVPPGGADDPLLAVSCKRDNSTAIFHVNGTYYRNDTATRMIYDRDIRQTSAQRNVVKRISLRHTPAWHHPSIDLTQPPEFSLVDDLVCLPLEEIYFEDVSFRPEHELLAVVPDRSGPNGTTFDLFNHTTWKCDRMDGQKLELADFGFPGETAFNVAPSYFVMLLDPCGVGRALVSRNVSSLNPNLALRNVALDKCLFAPFTELNAMSSLPPVPDPVAARPFLPDTLKRITIKRTLDGRHPSQTWRSRPVVQGFLPSEWALLRNLEYLDLSDETGQGLIEGPIPSTWLMMTKLRTINLTGHPNFCKDWHRVVSYQIQMHVLQTPYGVNWGLPKLYYGPKDPKNRARQWNVTVFDMDGAGWQWYDSSTGEAGYTAVIAPDGKCCWDTFSDQFAARNYTLEGPSETSGPWDYYGVMYSRLEVRRLCRP